MQIQILLPLSLALMAGLLMTRVFKKLGWNFPDVTAFLIAGLAIGPYGLGSVGVTGIGFSTFAELSAVGVLTDAALGFIAFAIGNEFRLSQLRHTGRAAVIIGIAQACAATLCVDAALIAIHFWLGADVLPLPVAITLGAIASATAPAATLMVVRQYKAKGPLTDLLLPIVALDDAVGLVLFAVSFGVAMALKGGSLNVWSIVFNPLAEIVWSLTLGSVLGWLLTQIEKLFFSNSNRLSMTICFVILTIALSSLSFPLGPLTVSASPLLVCMMLGTMFCNLSEFSFDIMGRADQWTAPLFATFFVLSGAELDLSVFTEGLAVVIGLVYILFRSLGKYYGTWISCALTGCGDTVRRYLGITLLPQAGVALGMCATASRLGGSDATLLRNLVLFSVLIYELTGPVMTQRALAAAGEIKPLEDEKKTRDRFYAKWLQKKIEQTNEYYQSGK
ncbi:MAG: cation:proton antiporter [Pyramidobacter sp.]|nr:cation:proton antiporter [Pyramidobacter sp.]